jgi:hypothetical protein
LLMAEVCEERVGDNVVLGAEVVHALRWVSDLGSAESIAAIRGMRHINP